MIQSWAVPWINTLVGRAIDGYRVDHCLDTGNFGMVFAVTRLDTEAEFAMKILPASNNTSNAAEFETEGLLLAKLVKCSNVISVVDTGDASIPMLTGAAPNLIEIPFPIKYIVMSLASGNLQELTGDPSRLAGLAWKERISLWRGAIKGLHQMHLKSVAHRDLKSSNCLLVVQGNQTEVRLADLGRSKDYTTAHSTPPETYLAGRGDRRFAPPENLLYQGGYDAEAFRSSDLYGIGSLLTELATGHPMTALAFGPWHDVVEQGKRDLATGYSRDLRTLRPQFRRAIAEIGEQFPAIIRHDGTAILTQLCDPLPEARGPGALARSSRREHGLEWLLRKADIMAKRLSVDKRRNKYVRTARGNRSA